MDISSFSDEDDFLCYWNNWSPSINSQRETCPFDEKQPPKKLTKNVVFNSSKVPSLISLTENPRFGNWIPPVHFLREDFNTVKKVLPDTNVKQSQSNEVSREKQKVTEINHERTKSALWKKDINLDWGMRVNLHDVAKYSASDFIWGIVNLGMFANIKVWVNEYGTICGSAEGKISKLYSSEISYIYITNTQLLRKMLGLSGAQWASLCESLEETPTTLKFDAFEVCDMTKKTDLEKLWIFICKRRHFLPDQCMLVKLCGAIKCMRRFQIYPKLLVQDIRTLLGEPIL